MDTEKQIQLVRDATFAKHEENAPNFVHNLAARDRGKLAHDVRRDRVEVYAVSKRHGLLVVHVRKVNRGAVA